MKKSETLKRPVPNDTTLDWRKDYLSRMQFLRPKSLASRNTDEPLEPGNSKLGQSSQWYASVLVWNLPSVASCPGASAWCRSICYNADPRADVFPVDRWLDNWAWFEESPSELETNIIAQLEASPHPTAVRIHSSGDFYSAKYISMWHRVIKQAASVKFWAYTRSWCVDELLPKLDMLRNCENLQLFASWDDTMSPAPKGWRRSLVYNPAEGRPNIGDGTDCPEQFVKVADCAHCRFCIEPRKGDVLFSLH